MRATGQPVNVGTELRVCGPALTIDLRPQDQMWTRGLLGMPCPSTRWAANRACVVIEHSLYPDHAAHSMYTASLFVDAVTTVLASLSDLPFAVSCLRFFLFFVSRPRFFAVVSNTSVSFSFSPVLWR